MIKQEIIDTLKKYELKDYIIISGASMVLQDIKESTSDIDITVNKETNDYLLEKYDCKFEKTVNDNKIYFIDNIINFSTHYYYEIDFIEKDDLKLQTIKSILELKTNLNRDKDKKDIMILKKHLKYK